MGQAADPLRSYVTLTFMRGALVALCITLLGGFVAVLFYVPVTGEFFTKNRIDFTTLRPIHTTFASAWIFLGGIAIVHRYMQDHAGPVSKFEKLRIAIQVLLWAIAGGGIIITLALGMTSGREYMGFIPIFGLLIFLGWILFAWNFFSATWRGFWNRPVYVTMWGVAVLFFMYTFVEQYLWWLLPKVYDQPIVDLRFQWKATGTLIGSFNLFVYGSLYYIGEKITGDKNYARSNLAYALLGVGLLNSFTNFGHHTYHIPQSESVKWISFLVSMTEVLILARVVWDIARSISRSQTRPFNVTNFFMTAAKWWTTAMLSSAILISIPVFNSLIHGTHAVTAHAMGTEIGIDSMILFAGISWLIAEIIDRRNRSDDPPLHTAKVKWLAYGFNIAAAVLVVWLHISGVVVGYTRYHHQLAPTWLTESNWIIFAVAGTLTAVFMSLLLIGWLRIIFRRSTKTILQVDATPALET